MKIGELSADARVEFAGIRLFDPHFYASGDPHLVWKTLREEEPVRWEQVDARRGFWIVSKHVDVSSVLKDYVRFTSERGTLLELLGTADVAGGKLMAVCDPPRHAEIRRRIAHLFASRNIRAFTDPIRAYIRRLLADPITAGSAGQPWDFVPTALELPMAFIGPLMQLPEDEWPRLLRAANSAFAAADPEYRGDHTTAHEVLFRAHGEIFRYFDRRVIEGLKGDPVMASLSAEHDGSTLTAEELVLNAYGLLTGATITTPHAVTATILALAEQPQRYSRWSSAPELLASGVEEALRWSSPINYFMRYATEDVLLHDVNIRAGDAVAVWLGSANRDSDVFDRPYVFDPARVPNPHVAFGFGFHYCVGAALARLTLQLFFEELFRVVRNIELAGAPDHLHSSFVAGMKHLPVVLYPRN